MYKTDEKIYADFRALIMGFLAEKGLSDWQVLQLEQPTIQTPESKSIFLSKILQKRYHWQWHDYKKRDGSFSADNSVFRLRVENTNDFLPIYANKDGETHISIDTSDPKTYSSMVLSENYYLEVWLQISALKKRTDGSIYEASSEDILNYVLTFLLGYNGIKSMREMGYMPLPVSEILNPVFSTPSDTTERFPNFTLKFLVQQSMENDVDSISSAKLNSYSV